MSAMTNRSEEPFCYTCISSAYWLECESCGGEGWVERDDDDFYGDDVALITCAWCMGRGGWWECLGSERHDLSDASIHRVPLDEREASRTEGGTAG